MQLNKDRESESLRRIPSPKDRTEEQIQGELILYEGSEVLPESLP